MIVVTDLAEVPADLGPTVATIGKFDGLHSGHRYLLDLVHAEAGEEGLASLVITFDRHPLAVFRPDECPEQIASVPQKLELLRGHGIDATIVLEFDAEFAALEPLEFVRDILVDRLRIRTLIVGRDFRFGHRAAGDVAFLDAHAEEFGYRVIVPPDLLGDGERRASSTWIREAIGSGDMRLTTRLLERHHVVSGIVCHGAKRGRELGFPTANLDPATVDGLIPADGVYAGWCTVGGVRWPAAISIGDNPTFDGVPQRQVEAHLLDADLDLYGQRLEVEFVDRIRGMVKFEGIPALIERMRQDVVEARAILAEDAARTGEGAGPR